MRANPRVFGQTQSPKNTSGRRSCLVPHVLTALLDRLLFKPDMYLDEMSEYYWNRYGLHASEASLRRSLKTCAWTRKKNRRIAQERESDLRDTYLHELSQYKFNQLVFVDESGCDTGAVYAVQGGRSSFHDSLLRSQGSSDVFGDMAGPDGAEATLHISVSVRLCQLQN